MRIEPSEQAKTKTQRKTYILNGLTRKPSRKGNDPAITMVVIKDKRVVRWLEKEVDRCGETANVIISKLVSNYVLDIEKFEE